MLRASGVGRLPLETRASWLVREPVASRFDPFEQYARLLDTRLPEFRPYQLDFRLRRRMRALEPAFDRESPRTGVRVASANGEHRVRGASDRPAHPPAVARTLPNRTPSVYTPAP